MQNHELRFSEPEIPGIAEEFLKIINGFRHVAFYGDMGSGKTTFIKGLCNILGTGDLVSSPTFTIVNEYDLEGGDLIYHFDFYRIKKSEELLDIGFYDYCSENNYVFIEWPEKAEEIIPDDFIRVILKVSDSKRILSFTL